MEFKEAILNYAEQPINRQLLQSLLVGYKRPYDKINELVKQGILIPVKVGIYIPGKNVNIAGPETFLLAIIYLDQVIYLWIAHLLIGDLSPKRYLKLPLQQANIIKNIKQV